jgi:putative tryptophan/tyrosine transport system substrate-binding protein
MRSMRRREFITLLGGAVAWPLATRAQQRTMPVIAYLNAGREKEFQSVTAAFLKGLGDAGYTDGRNVEIVYRWAESRYERLPAMAADMVRRRVDLIFASGGNAPALAAKGATATIPIVFTCAADPVKLGLVTNLHRPGGNVTGFTFLTTDLLPKRVDLLLKAVPLAKSIGYLVNPMLPDVEDEIRIVEMATAALGVGLAVVKASTPSEIEAGFASLAEQRIGALLVDADAFLYVQRDQMAALAVRHAIPAIYALREYTEAGGLMSFGASLREAWRLGGTYVGRVLKGEKPGDLPVQRPARMEMVVNLKAAKALGMTFPPELLALADDELD